MRSDCDEKNHKIQVLKLDNEDLRKRLEKLKRKLKEGSVDKDFILNKKPPT